MFHPTSPPALAPTIVPPLIELVPSTVTLVTVPLFTPASTPADWPDWPTLGFSVTEALVRSRFWIVPRLEIAPNNPILLALGSVGAIVSPSMVRFWPSNVPLKPPVERLPIGTKPTELHMLDGFWRSEPIEM